MLQQVHAEAHCLLTHAPLHALVQLPVGVLVMSQVLALALTLALLQVPEA